MNENKVEIIKKLRFLPKEELSALVIKVYAPNNDELKNAIKKIIKLNTTRPEKFIFKRCNSENCIALISEFGELSDKHITIINKLYEEYRYGLNPNLFFSQLIFPIWKEFDKIKKELPILIEEKSTELNCENEPKYIKFEVLEISKAKDVIEILFEYQRRIDYIDPGTNEPAYIYTLEEGIIWLTENLNALIVKSSNYKVSSFINKIMSEFLKCHIRIFSLHKKTVNSVLGTESLRSGNYINLYAGPDEIEGKSIRDNNFMTKTEGRKTDEKYDRKSSFHNVEEITGTKIGLNVNSQLGKISIRKHLRKTEIKNWAMKLMGRIIEEMDQLKESDIDSFLKNYQIESIKSLNNVKKGGKEVIRDIIIGLNKVKSEGNTNFSTNYSIADIYSKLRDYFNFIFIPTCNSCGSHFFLCCETEEESGINFIGNAFTATCNSCKKKNVDINNHFICNCGDKLEGNLDANVIAVPTEECVNLINSSANEIGLENLLNSNELLKFSNGIFEIISTNYKYLYNFDELPSFKNIPKLNEIESNIAKTQLFNVEKILGEKCTKYNDSNCRSCLIDKKGNCLQRVIAYFTEGDLHAHSPVEFGDVSFRQTIDGSSQNIICLVKRFKDAPKVNNDHKYTMKNNAGLLNQVVETIFDSRVDFLGIVSGADIDPRLRETIITLIKIKHKKVVFFEKKELVRILSNYEW